MILFDYRCTTCGWRQEELVSRPAPESIPCEFDDCDGARQRIFPGPRIQSPLSLGDGVRAVTPGNCEDTSNVPPWGSDMKDLATGKKGYWEWEYGERNKRKNEISTEVAKQVGDPRPTIYGGAAASGDIKK